MTMTSLKAFGKISPWKISAGSYEIFTLLICLEILLVFFTLSFTLFKLQLVIGIVPLYFTICFAILSRARV